MAAVKGYLLSKKKLKGLGKHLTQVKSIKGLPEEGTAFVVFDFDDAAFTYQALISLRHQPHYTYCPFYSWDNPPEDVRRLLLEGHFDETVPAKVQAMEERIEACKKNDDESTRDTEDVQIILTRYLFAHKHTKVLPHTCYDNPYGFIYPIVEALSKEGTANDYWYVLNSLVKREYLEVSETISELQVCPGCEGGLLNFKNCCPNCESVDLHIEPFVHCFSCGNIGAIKEFMKHQELVCNRCQTVLKHIGIDYDKPIEDKICERCQHRFFEPNTLFMCLVCERVGNPETLNTRKLNAFSLTRKGGEFAQNRLKKLAIDLGNFLELITFNMLELIIQWQAQLAKRHSEVQFIVGVIYVDNINELISSIGFLKTEQQLVIFYESVRKLFRSSDLLSVDDEKLFCFLSMTSLDQELNYLKQEQTRIQSQIDAINRKSTESLKKHLATLKKDILASELVYNKFATYYRQQRHIAAIELEQARKNVIAAKEAYSQMQHQIKQVMLENDLMVEVNYKRKLEEVNNKISQAEVKKKYFAIKSPAKGTVKDIYIHPGEFLPSGQDIIDIITKNNLHVVVYVDPKSTDELELGATVDIKFPDRFKTKGKVINVPNYADRQPMAFQKSFIAERKQACGYY